MRDATQFDNPVVSDSMIEIWHMEGGIAVPRREMVVWKRVWDLRVVVRVRGIESGNFPSSRYRCHQDTIKAIITLVLPV